LISAHQQTGAVLILLALILGLAATAYLLHAANATNLQAKQDEKTYKALGEAKKALIAWSASNRLHPGQMPFPDRNADGNYDGNSDCNSATSTFVYSFLIGQLPILAQTNPCISPQDGLAEDFKDADGNKLWYVVSQNLTHIYENFPVTLLHDPVINPDMVSFPQNNPDVNNYPAIQPEVRSYPWLKVLDSNGNLISDRVAAVIIAPGNAMGSQDRSAVAPSVNQYLDSFVKGSVTYSNANYLAPDQAFIMGQDSRTVGINDTRFVKPYNFNDKLVYITIDELMAALNNRAASEAASLLNQYKNKTGQFPYAAPLDARQDNHVSTALSQKGLLPIDGTDRCTCESQFKCTCSFAPITKVTFKRGSGTWAARSGACTRYTANCNCEGAGSCTAGSEYFSCDANGVCEHNVSGSNSYIYTVPDYADIQVLSGGCFVSGKQATCNDEATIQIGLDEPSWFKDNLWQDFLYYEWVSTADLQVGAKTGISAVLVATGQTIANAPFASKGSAQMRPSSLISDYLDSVENTDTDADLLSDGHPVFDATNKIKTNNFNDQIYIVSP
jgi:hypothetical protein